MEYADTAFWLCRAVQSSKAHLHIERVYQLLTEFYENRGRTSAAKYTLMSANNYSIISGTCLAQYMLVPVHYTCVAQYNFVTHRDATTDFRAGCYNVTPTVYIFVSGAYLGKPMSDCFYIAHTS